MAESNYMGSSHTGTTSISSSSSSYTSRRESLIKLKESIFSMIVSIEDKTPRKGMKNYVYFVVLNVYVILASLGIGMLDSYHWGLYGDWIWRVFNYLITLSIDKLPYEGLIALEVLFVCFSVLGLAIFVLTAKSVEIASRNMKLLRNCIFYYGNIQFFFCLIGTFAMTSFIDCDYTSQVSFENYDDPQNVLMRAPSVMCQSVASIVLMVIGIIGILISIVNTIIYGQILGNTHLKNTSPFIMESPFFFSIFLAISQLQILLNYAIPNQYMYGRSAVHITLSLLLTPILFYFLPYFVGMENSIWSGILFAKILSPIGSLIAFVVNSNDSWDMGLGLTFIPVVLIAIGFLLGFTLMEAYTRFFYYSIRKEMLTLLGGCYEKSIDDMSGMSTLMYFERGGHSLFKSFVEQKRLNRLGVFLKFSMLSGKKATQNTYNISDRQLAVSFIKSVAQHKSFAEPELIISSALIASYIWEEGSHEYALGLLRRVKQQKLSFFSGITLRERLKEIETSLHRTRSSDASHGISIVDVKHILAKLEKQYNGILALHKAIWKEFFNMEINYSKVMEINRKITELTFNTEQTFENLMKDFSSDKNVLRMYGKFLENILFNNLRAGELYQEANDIENEETVKGEIRAAKAPVGGIKGSIRNKVVPLKEKPTHDDTRSSIDSRSSISKSAASLSSKIKKMEKDTTKQNINGLDNGFSKEFVEDDFGDKMGLEAAEDPQVKKEMLYRSALATPSDNKFTYSCLIASIALFFLLFIASFAFSIASLVNSTSDVKLIKVSCMPSITTLSMQLDIRMEQLLFTLYNNTVMPQSLIDAGAANFSTEHKERIQDVLSSLQELQNSALNDLMSDDMFYDYSESNVLFYNPVIGQYPGEYTVAKQFNTSISAITNTLIQFLKEFKTYLPQQYNNTISNYKVMYFWHNRDIFSSVFKEFCSNIVDRSYATVSNTNNAFMYFYFCSLGLLVISCVAMLTFNLLVMRSLKSVLKLIEKTIPKDALGKIYHQMATKYAENGEGAYKSNFTSNPKFRASFFTILIFISTCLCVSTFFYEVFGTSDKTERIMRNVERSASISVDAHDITGKIGEVLIFSVLQYDKYPINSKKLLSMEQVIEYHESVYDIKKKISKEWNLLLYGDITTNSEPLIGLFTEVDNLIKGSHCANTTTKCTSLNDKMNELYLESIVINERHNAKNKDMYSIFPEFFNGLYSDCKVLAKEFEQFMNIYVSSIERDNSSTIVTIFGVLGFFIVPLFGYLLVLSFDKHVNEVQTVRMLLNYIKIDHLEAKDEMRNYVLYHKIFTSSRGANSLNKKEFEDLKVKSILNSAVDGAVSCNDYEIEVYNPAAQRMFGKLPEDVIGKPLWSLFNPNCEETIQKTIENRVQVDSSLADKNAIQGETLDLECIRKNGTTFPARVSISYTLFENKRVITCFIRDITSENKSKSLLAEEKKNSEKLLRNVLPESVARQLKSGEKLIADKLPDITCFFSDMVGFTKLSSSLSANDVVQMLSTIVTGFDKLTDKYELEKIKTIGDAYFCVGGLMQASDHPERVLRFSIDTFTVIRDFNLAKMKEMVQTNTFSSSDFNQVDIRVGINTGAAIAGVIGTKKFAYDLWGETINVGSRMESNSQPGRIHLSRPTYERVYDLDFEFEERKIEIKGKPIQSYFLSAKHHAKSHISKAEQQHVMDEFLNQVAEEDELKVGLIDNDQNPVETTY